jgi:quercetin dioxygenase-like cupin family protein
MNFRTVLLAVGGAAVSLAIAGGQPASPILTNLDSAKWTHDKGDPPGMEAVVLREDSQTGGMEMLVRFPPGHAIKPHYHESNERLIVLEGQMTVKQDSGETALTTGGSGYLPARQVQRLSCSSATRCTVYLAWDGKPNSHAAQ